MLKASGYTDQWKTAIGIWTAFQLVVFYGTDVYENTTILDSSYLIKKNYKKKKKCDSCKHLLQGTQRQQLYADMW